MAETRAAHTSGPWHAIEHYSDSVSVVDADGFEIAEAHDRPILLGYSEKLGIAHWADAPGRAYRDLSAEQQAANARLIAAAPELLSACQAALFALSYERTHALAEYENAYAALRLVLAAAIAKAKRSGRVKRGC